MSTDAQGEAALDVAEAIIQETAELPDRTSPADWPEAMLVTADELRSIVVAHWPDRAALAAAQAGGVEVTEPMVEVAAQTLAYLAAQRGESFLWGKLDTEQQYLLRSDARQALEAAIRALRPPAAPAGSETYESGGTPLATASKQEPSRATAQALGSSPRGCAPSASAPAGAPSEIEQLRAALKQSLAQWSMYADMVERNDGFDLASEQSPEGEMYRSYMALLQESKK